MITAAARLLGVTRQTVHNYINKYKVCADAVTESRERVGDRLETTLIDQALGRLAPDGKSWVQPPNIPALIFLGKVHPAMRDRGYSEKINLEHTGKDGGPIKGYITISPDDWDNLD